jgi:hypothetical protein
MKKTLIIALVLSSLSINSKPYADENLHTLIEMLTDCIKKANNHYADVMHLVDKDLLPAEHSLKEIEPIDIDSLQGLSKQAIIQIILNKTQEIRDYNRESIHYQNQIFTHMANS